MAANLSLGLGVEEFVVVFGGGEEADASEVDAETVDGLHGDGVVRRSVVVVFDPVVELSVEGIQGGEIEFLDEELVTNAPIMWCTT